MNIYDDKKLKKYELTMKQLLIGNRIPRDYFITKGKGESDIAEHAGSFHIALKDAGIETANIMTYSSIMPGISKEIDKYEIVHGEVMECIMSKGTVERGKQISVGIIYGWLYDKKTGERYGGLVCENTNEDEHSLVKSLSDSINELYENGFTEKYNLRDVRFIIESVNPSKKYGTAIVAICFTNFILPIYE